MREFVLVLLGRVLGILVALVALRVSTLLLEPAEFGRFAILQSMQLLAIWFLTQPVVQYLNRRLHEWSAAGVLDSRLRLYFLYVNGCALLAAAAALLWLRLTAAGGGSGLWMSFPLMFLGVIALAWGPVLSAFLNMLGDRLAFVTLMTAAAVLGLLLSLALTWLSPGGANWFAGTVVGNAAVGVFAYRTLRARMAAVAATAPPPPAGEGRQVLRFVVPLAASAALMWFIVSGHRLAFERLWGAEAMGVAAVSLALSTQVWAVLEMLATQYLHPYLYARIAGGDALACSDYANVLGPLYLGCSGVIAVNAVLIQSVLVSHPARLGLLVFFVAIYADLARVITNAFSMSAHARKDTRPLIVSYLLAVLVVAAGLGMAARQGLDVVAGSAVLVMGASMALVAVLWFARRLVLLETDWRAWALGGVLAFAGGLVGLASLQEGHWLAAALWERAVVSALVGTAFLVILLRNNPALQRLLQAGGARPEVDRAGGVAPAEEA